METSDRNDKSGARGLRIHQALARQVGIAILSGHFKPGDAFVGEIEHSETLHVSRTAYREAMRIPSSVQRRREKRLAERVSR